MRVRLWTVQATGVALLALPTLVWAQTAAPIDGTIQQLDACRNITDDSARLACLDKLLAKDSAQAVQQPELQQEPPLQTDVQSQAPAAVQPVAPVQALETDPASDSAAATEDFGSEDLRRQELEETPKSVELTLKEAGETKRGKQYFVFENCLLYTSPSPRDRG